MQTFKAYFTHKMQAQSFRKLYAQECHVCAKTIRIFEIMADRGLTLEQTARKMNTTPARLAELYAADYCDPDLVVRLCLLLDEPPPKACPRRDQNRKG